MTADHRPYLMRPVEFTNSGSNDFDVDCALVTDFPEGVYANGYSLLFAVVNYLYENDDASWDYRVNDNGIAEIYQNTSSTVVLGWHHSDLGSLIGFTADNTTVLDDTWTAASTTPWGVWAPTFQVADQGWWNTIGSDVATGARSQNGTWAGMPNTGTPIYNRTMRFTAELAERVLISKRTTSTDMTAEEFFNGSMTAYPTVSTYAPAQGFWVYTDFNNLIADCNGLKTEPWMDADTTGVDFCLSASPDLKAFCYTAPEWVPDWSSEAFFPRSTLRYNFQVTFNTAPRENWTHATYTPPA